MQGRQVLLLIIRIINLVLNSLNFMAGTSINVFSVVAWLAALLC